MKMSEEVSSQNQAAQEKTIHGLVQFCKIHSTYNRFLDYLETVRDGSFDDLGGMVSTWTDLIKTAASDVTDYEMKTRGDLVSSFNTSDDDCDAILREIRKKYSKANVVPSGIPELDTGFLKRWLPTLAPVFVRGHIRYRQIVNFAQSGYPSRDE